MVSIDCLQIMKFDESYYVSPLIQNMFVRLLRWEFLFGVNGLGKPKSNSMNKSAQKARRKLGKFNTTFSGSFLIN